MSCSFLLLSVFTISFVLSSSLLLFFFSFFPFLFSRTSANRDPGSLSEAESDEENEEGDYTVYECPGLAATGEMEVKNPLFHDDPTPATPTPRVDKEEEDRM